MPLLGKKPFLLSALPSDKDLLLAAKINSGQPPLEVYQVPFTKEIFLKYEQVTCNLLTAIWRFKKLSSSLIVNI
jgi:hypothetical protein